MAKHEFSLSDEEIDAIAERIAAKLAPGKAPVVEGTAKPPKKDAAAPKKDAAAPKKDATAAITRADVLGKLQKFRAEYSLEAVNDKIKVYGASFGKVDDLDLPKLFADLDTPPAAEASSEEEF